MRADLPPFCHQDNSHETVLCLKDQTDWPWRGCPSESERPTTDLASFRLDKKNVAAVKYGLRFRYQSRNPEKRKTTYLVEISVRHSLWL